LKTFRKSPTPTRRLREAKVNIALDTCKNSTGIKIHAIRGTKPKIIFGRKLTKTNRNLERGYVLTANAAIFLGEYQISTSACFGKAAACKNSCGITIRKAASVPITLAISRKFAIKPDRILI